ncbi:TonB-dependent receptor plug domain-containing protein [Azonexus sp. IMCC34842]|uniref:TonB-dependent receptor plug domain-containing protein n=1 Tax=Azonexus sp. IMCC34842 TaxID=3420950 RepID=UPI003D10879A
MGNRIRPLTAAMAVAFSTTAVWQSAAAQSATVLDDVVVSASKIRELPTADAINNRQIAPQRPATSDTASLLKDIPGVSIHGAGGVSGLPAIHGLADDRLRIKVDGMDLISACANHMNPALSYIDPSNVDSLKVYAGITPVSVGGDSIGGAIIVNSPAPRFAKAGEGLLTGGELGSFYRSNGDAWGVNASATIATENLSIRYSASTAQSDNYKSAKEFKPGVLATGTSKGSRWIAGDEVASTAYKTQNQQLGVAYRLDNHLFDLKLGYQHIPYQGFPNQHMDMTDNKSTQVNLGYTGQYAWGTLESRVYHERTRHKMDFAEDKYFYTLGMPMNTEGKNTGALVKAEINLSERDLLRVGSEYQRYRLDDWWPPVGTGGMSPNTFVNINNGQRDRFDLFGEWEGRWTPQWMTLIGVRGSQVTMDAGRVAGYKTTYDTSTPPYNANTFNNRDRSRTDHNLDLTLLARYTPDASQTYEGGYSRKTRSPSLYERYTWSGNGMGMTMNNWVNDGNGYVGNVDLKPEVAHTVSVSADWHDAARTNWGVKLTPYYSLVDNYIDATQAIGKTWVAGQFNYLTLANQDARLYGLDLSGFAALGRIDGIGGFTARGVIGYTHGKNRSTGNNLYNIMPLNARLALDHRLGNWTNTIEEVLVSAKDDVSAVRNEMKTAGYGLLNLRSSYEWKSLRFDIGLENALDKQYALPLGGAYTGQGRTMSLNGAGAPYGVTVPGMGRSLYAGINIKF